VLLCPGCNIPLCRIDYEGVTVHLCPDCRGALVEAARLETIKRRRVRRWTRRQKRDTISLAMASDNPAPLRCPRCLMSMEKVTVPYREGAFHLERCRPCGLHWFDRGELELVQVLFEKERDGRTEKDWDRLERLGVARMQLEEERQSFARRAEETKAPFPGLGGSRISAPWHWWSVALGALGVLAYDVYESHQGQRAFHRRQALKRAAVAVGLIVILVLIFLIWRVFS